MAVLANRDGQLIHKFKKLKNGAKSDLSKSNASSISQANSRCFKRAPDVPGPMWFHKKCAVTISAQVHIKCNFRENFYSFLMLSNNRCNKSMNTNKSGWMLTEITPAYGNHNCNYIAISRTKIKWESLIFTRSLLDKGQCIFYLMRFPKQRIEFT